jgi:hypothetical protein
MTKQTRYFMAGSAAVVVAGLGVGLIAFYSGGFPALSASTGPTELAYVPADATVVAYADVRGIMDSELRQRLKATLPIPETGQQEFQEKTGIDIERDIDYVVAAMTPNGTTKPAGLVVARGRFDNVKLESLVREHGGAVEDYRGKRLLNVSAHDMHSGVNPDNISAPDPQRMMTMAFLEPGLVAVGEAVSVKHAIDAQMSAQSITTNEEMMNLVSEIERSNNAWVVGRFDVLASQAKLPDQVALQIPSVKWFAAAGHINGGVVGTLRAEARDEQAADNLRDIVRGFLALARMQAQNDPKLNAFAQSLELTGTGKTVSLTFTVPTEILQLMGPKAEAVQQH